MQPQPQSTKTEKEEDILPVDFLKLSMEDVNRLLSEHGSQSRLNISDKISDHYTKGVFNKRELAIAEQIFRILLRDTEVGLRASLSKQLKDSPMVPRDIAQTISKDVESVSLPFIQHSTVLNDFDLLDLIRDGEGLGKLTAIAKRKHVSPQISDALVDSGHETVITELVKNDGATIGEQSVARIMEEHGQSEDVLNALVERKDLPITFVERMIATVSDSLATTLRQRYQITQQQVDTESERTREVATLRLVDNQTSPIEIEKLVNQLHAFGRLKPSILLGALCRGNILFFETALGRLAGIPVRNARALVADRGDLGFRALYAKVGMPESLFDAARLTLRTVLDMIESSPEQPGTPKFAHRLQERLLAEPESGETENLSYMLALIRQMGGETGKR